MKKVSQIWYPKTQVSTQVAPLVIPSQFFGWKSYILKQTWCLSVCLCGQKLGSAWKILPVIARSLWSVLGGGGRESPVKHEAGGGASTGGEGPTGALCTGFTLTGGGGGWSGVAMGYPLVLHKRHWGLATTENPDPDGSVPTSSHYWHCQQALLTCT
jgi:hypothetical protein